MNSVECVIFALERVKARVRTNDTAAGLLWLLAGIAAYLLAVIAADQVAPLEHATRLVLAVLLALLALAALVFVLLRPTLKRVNDLYAARLIERLAETQFRNSVVSFVELQRDPRVSADIREAVAAKAAHDLRSVDLDLVVDRRPLVRATVALALAAVAAVVFAALTPKSFPTSVARAVGGDLAVPTATWLIDVTPPDETTVMAGEGLTVAAAIGGAVPRAVDLLVSRDGRYWDTLPMRPAGANRWEFPIGDLREDLRFRVRAADARSAEHRIRVRPLPSVTEVKTRLTWPAYTRLSAEAHDTGNVEALAGTVVEVVARTNVPLRDAPQLVFGDGTRKLAMTLVAPGAAEARGTFVVDRDDTYAIQFFDLASGRTNAAPLRYQVKALADQTPAVELAGVAGPVKVAADGAVTFNVRARDDYGLDRLVFVCRREAPAAPPGVPATTLVSAASADQAVLVMPEQASIRVADLGLAAGDEATCWFAAYDRRPAGEQEGRSTEFRLIVAPPESSQGAGSAPHTADAGHGTAPPQSNGQGATKEGTPSPRPGELTAEQQRDLDRMRDSLAKLGQALAHQGAGPSAPGPSSASPPKQPGPGDTPPSAGNQTASGAGTPSTSTGTASSGGGPASEGQLNSTTRPPDQQLGPRPPDFTESGHGTPAPPSDARLLQALGPQLRRLDEQLRRGTVDEQLLKDLGWDRAQLQTFVSEFKDRFGAFAAPPSEATPSGPAQPPRPTEVTVSRGGPGTGQGGTAVAARGTNDGSSEAIEVQKRRVSPRFSRLVEEYLKSVSEAETK